ncbi:Trp biosynthesis-associated membrane protein [Microbacterium sp. QXD-8]|uniref:Trp biosynthesis-associated membrane protein n=1 Tax=Microbacterium psychrotolerans TaxID=3068321 RepID=A0ABU0Z1G0_9MICO|nr:Trp biosynthesis-associated membrane protein [Microbacterium sp. QXD-8]MDQ7877845.1 Trp biosynthesis-associated membrane protein [Microbacterium sp. QXD-8]
MIRRARLLAVVVTVLCGALGVISSTQTWLTVVLEDAARHVLEVPGASALPVLAPLSLAVLALGAALSIVGLALRFVFGALAVLIGGVLAWLTARIVLEHPISAVASVVTESTGIAGESSVATLVASIDATLWPAVTLAVWVVLIAAGGFVLATAHGWSRTGRRYRTDDPAQPALRAGSRRSGGDGSRPHDAAGSQAIDDWDDLSRGEDPTA